jgi:HTH-type transcriptional regulator/antitoxin HigA
LIVHVRYDVGIIFIKHVLTHAEYTKMTKAGTLMQKRQGCIMATKRLDFRKPHLLRDDVEYEAALHEVESLMETASEAGSAAYERLEFLSLLIERYEEERFPSEQASPQAVVEFVAEQRGISRTELARLMGGKSRLSEFLTEKRDLSINRIRALRDALGIPADLLIAADG